MKKKRVDTLTFHGVINHGAVLQAYALQKFLQKNGFESELINYQPWYFIKQVYRPAKGFFKSLLKYSRLNKFRRFSNQHINVSKEIFFNKKQFSKISHCDAIVCGSDQIWNKTITNGSLDPVFFIDGPKNIKKIAYAASAGSHELSLEPSACKLLKNLEVVGVREEYLKNNILENFNKTKAEMVLDPTLLLNKSDYKEILYSEFIPHGEYMVSYEVSTDVTRGKYENFVGDLSKSLKLPVYHIGDKPIRTADRNIINIAPNDWVSIMNSAKVVVTNSFHGTAFAVNFKKPFFMLSHHDEARNVRPRSFLKSIGMQKFFIDSDEFDEKLVYRLYDDKDYSKYEELVEFSKKFLLESLVEV